MKSLFVACAVFATVASAETPAAKTNTNTTTNTAGKMEANKASNEMAGNTNPYASWKPRKVTKEDKKGIDALYTSSEESMKKGDVEACAAMYDFPVFMITDDSQGVPSASQWTKEQWVAMMKPAMEGMPKDAKHTLKTKASFVTDSLATVVEEHTMTMGKEKMAWKSASTVVLKDGKWMFKTAMEGGWGDSMTQKGASAPMPATNSAAGSK